MSMSWGRVSFPEVERVGSTDARRVLDDSSFRMFEESDGATATFMVSAVMTVASALFLF